MRNLDFPQPATILVDLGFPRSVANVYDAFAYLKELPAFMRDEAYEAMCDACRDALRGKCTTDEAYDVFIAYARRRSILVDEPFALMTMKAKTEPLPA